MITLGWPESAFEFFHSTYGKPRTNFLASPVLPSTCPRAHNTVYQFIIALLKVMQNGYPLLCSQRTKLPDLWFFHDLRLEQNVTPGDMIMPQANTVFKKNGSKLASCAWRSNKYADFPGEASSNLFFRFQL